MRLIRNRVSQAVAAAVLIGSVIAPATAQVIFRDDFNGAGNVDPTAWRLPFGEVEGTFVGRTAFGGDPATDLPQQVGGNAEITLDTFSPLDPGNAFLGTDVLTKRGFAGAGGLTIESRMRLAPGAPGGLVNGFFLFDVVGESAPETPIRDEIDWELISNQTTGASTQDPASNLFNDVGFSGPGSGGDLQFHDVMGLDLTQFQTYRIDWVPPSGSDPGSVEWFVNGASVRTVTTDVPDDVMQLHFNLWAPDSDFAAAFNAGLQPDATGPGSTFKSEVDWVEVRRFNTDISANLLGNPGFETVVVDIGNDVGQFPLIQANETRTGEWLQFGNVFSELELNAGGQGGGIPADFPEGVRGVKLFGPFSGSANASGLVQQVAASEGETFEASVQALTDMADSILGTENFATVQLSFVDALGNVLEASEFIPINNAFDFPLIDGRDPNATTDTFVSGQVNGIAPATTAFARISLFFNQSDLQQGGSLVFDDASLVRLTAAAPPAIPGDFDGDGDVDVDDFGVFVNSFQLSPQGGPPFADGDFDEDGDVDVDDFGVFVNSFQNFPPTPGVAVPEPGAVALVAILGVALSAARRRG